MQFLHERALQVERRPTGAVVSPADDSFGPRHDRSFRAIRRRELVLCSPSSCCRSRAPAVAARASKSAGHRAGRDAGALGNGADNDYPIQVKEPNDLGQLEPARAHRFHDGYLAGGAFVDAGWVRRPWADRLLVRGFITQTAQDLQHNAFMTVPYGGVTFDARTLGGNLRYRVRAGAVTFDSVTGYAYARSHLLDVDDCAYNWFGRCLVERRQGEIEPGNPRDSLDWEQAHYSRTRLEWELAPRHHLLLAISPSFVTRTGDEREQTSTDQRDPLEAQRELLTIVNGLEYRLDALGTRLENRAFLKQYLQFAWADEEVAEDVFVARDRQTHRYGFGDGVRYRITDWLYAKASYEWTRACRAPSKCLATIACSCLIWALRDNR